MKAYKLLTMVVVSLFMAACGSSSDDPDVDEPQQQYSITLQSTDIVLSDNAASSQTINFTATAYWVATSSDSWCKLSPTQGTSAVSALTADVEENNTTAERTATITIKLASNTSKSVTLKITQAGKKEDPVTPDASQTLVQATTTEAKAVFEYLKSVYGSKTLSAAMANVNWNTNEADLVYKATGKYPAIATFDYIHLAWSPANWIDYSNTKVAEDWWNAGGIVAASWHWNVPASETDTDLNHYTCTPGNGSKGSDGNWTTTFRPKNIFVDGTWEKKTADADLEKMTNMLLLLQDKGIPVIWRPLHEAAGNTYEYTGGTAWFWWGYDGADTFVKLWRYVFEFFAQKGVKNLIWVWTTQTKDDAFYPGDDYVDIVGRDLYGGSGNAYGTAQGDASQFTTINASYPKKMTALSETGNVAKISEQWSAGAKWLYFMPWYQYDATTLDGHQYANTAWWKDAMAQDYVVTRDQLPSFK